MANEELRDEAEAAAALGQYSRLVAAILSTLLRNALKRADLSWLEFDTLLLALVTNNRAAAEQMFEDTMTWLSDEGYIRVGDAYSGSENELRYADCTVTAYCLGVLDRQIESLGRSGREIVMQSSVGELSASNYVKAGSLLGGVLGGFTKSIS